MYCLPKKAAKKIDSLSKSAEASLGAGGQPGEREIWAPRRTCCRWAQDSHYGFICPFIQCSKKSCPEQGQGIALGWRAQPIPMTYSFLLDSQERLPQPGPASGSLSGVSTRNQDLRPCWALGLMGPLKRLPCRVGALASLGLCLPLGQVGIDPLTSA